MDHPKPLNEAFPGPKLSLAGDSAKPATADRRSAMKQAEEKPTIFRKGMIPEPGQMPPAHTAARVELIYNLLKGIIFFGRRNKPKMEAALREIKNVNAELHDRVKTYYDRLTQEQISFFIGPRPKFHDDGSLAIYDHNRDNPVLQTILKEERPADVNLETLQPKSKLVLPASLGGIIRG